MAVTPSGIMVMIRLFFCDIVPFQGAWSRFCRFAAFETSCFDRYGKISQEIFEIVIVAGVYRLSVARASVYRPRANLCTRPFVWSRLLPFARFGWLRKLAERGRSLRLLCYND